MKELMESSYLSVMSEQNDRLRKENKHLQSVIDKAIEVLKLCNSECAKETIEILRSKE